MADTTAPGTTGGLNTGAAGLTTFDMQQLGMEVAGELGVDPAGLSVSGLTPEKLREYEVQLHSRNRRGGSR